MDCSDRNYEQAADLWASLLEKDMYLCIGNYVIIETLALVQDRLGFEAANLWHRDVLGLAEILRIDRSMHNLGYELWLSLGRRKLSFVDCASFMAMRTYGIEKVFGFDAHFAE